MVVLSEEAREGVAVPSKDEEMKLLYPVGEK